ncbi:hypothetical protein ONJ16_25710, partial [Salmonella enterica subsp. enterica serovar Montevideo]|nr:hypothetical protein [Salmonella enterica subsp. enterica serovar Montevideo]
QMAMIAREIEQKLNIDVQIGGAEAEAAILGALTTPGTTRPLAYPRPRQPYVRICAWDRWKVRRSRRSNSCMKNCAPPASKAIAA